MKGFDGVRCWDLRAIFVVVAAALDGPKWSKGPKTALSRRELSHLAAVSGVWCCLRSGTVAAVLFSLTPHHPTCALHHRIRLPPSLLALLLATFLFFSLGQFLCKDLSAGACMLRIRVIAWHPHLLHALLLLNEEGSHDAFADTVPGIHWKGVIHARCLLQTCTAHPSHCYFASKFESKNRAAGSPVSSVDVLLTLLQPGVPRCDVAARETATAHDDSSVRTARPCRATRWGANVGGRSTPCHLQSCIVLCLPSYSAERLASSPGMIPSELS